MDNFLQQLINGLTLGSIYGLIAIGYTMVFGIIGMVNFAHGDVFMLSAFIALIIFMILTQILHLGSLPIVFVVVLVAAMALTGLVELGDRAACLPAACADRFGWRRSFRRSECRSFCQILSRLFRGRATSLRPNCPITSSI